MRESFEYQSGAYHIYDTWDNIYKYRAFNQHAISILENNELHFSYPSQLNDPFDCQFNLLESLRESFCELDLSSLSKDRKLTIEQINNDIKNNQEYIKSIQKSFDKLSICSFSSVCNNVLLWSHYADGFRGFCLGFDPGLIRERTKNGLDIITPCAVEYTNVNPFALALGRFATTDFYSIPPKKSPSKESFYKVFVFNAAIGTKTLAWSYESEFRFIRIINGSGNVKFPPEALKEIIFGFNMNRNDRKLILRILNKPKWKHVGIREVIKSSTSPNTEIQDLKKNHEFSYFLN